MRRTCTVLMLSAALLIPASGAHGIVVTPTGNAVTLVSQILGSGITLVGTPTFIGAPLGAGTFTGGMASGIGIPQGIILSSGLASSAPGPNSSGSTSWDFGVAGDASLDLLVPGSATQDATGIEFDFSKPAGLNSDLVFNFVFSSEEYLEYVGSIFNDVFGFYVDGVNIGLVPGTTLPITVNTVNQSTNATYYVNNPDGAAPPFALEYDGFTKAITARLKGLTPGTHHMKLVIADTSDGIYDSAVFIQAGTFGVNIWGDAIDVGGGWKWLSWFGFFVDYGDGWIWHNEHHLMFASGTSTSSIWLYTPDMGWLWTSNSQYPFLYRSSPAAWLWYQKGSVGPRWFYNLTTSTWESH